MFKKKDEIHNFNYIYSVFDTVAKMYVGTFTATSDAVMIRSCLPSILVDYPLRDIEIYRIGRIDFVTANIESVKHKLVNLDSYKFPHFRLSSKGEDLSLDELDEGMKKVSSKDNSEDDNKVVVSNNVSEVSHE